MIKILNSIKNINFFINCVSGINVAAMTDPQLSNNNNNNANNNNNSSTNNNNDGEPKYLHKKFKKMASTEVATKSLHNDEASTPIYDTKDCKEIGKTDTTELELEIETETVISETGKKSHLCPYCKLSCAKPSVLQKHIRAHTNERPFPCLICGFAFKTKSNLYKHCRSRAHILKEENQSDANKVKNLFFTQKIHSINAV